MKSHLNRVKNYVGYYRNHHRAIYLDGTTKFNYPEEDQEKVSLQAVYNSCVRHSRNIDCVIWCSYVG